MSLPSTPIIPGWRASFSPASWSCSPTTSSSEGKTDGTLDENAPPSNLTSNSSASRVALGEEEGTDE
jgi:hypothetical protein